MINVDALHILGMGAAHPDNLIDNRFIEDLNVGTNAQWIMEKIGIETRRTSLPLDYIARTRNQDPREALKVASHTPHQLALSACRQALQRAAIRPDQVGLLLGNFCTPLNTVPTESAALARALKLRCTAYDVFTACPVFALHSDFLSRFNAELPEYVLCVSSAALTQNVNYSDRSDGAIWGDGAAAWVISGKHSGKLKILDTFFMADPTRCDAVVVDTYGFFHQDGRAVRDFSVRQTVRLIKNVEERFGIDWQRDVFIGHQANRTMLEQIVNNREIPPHNHWHNVTAIGNQAGASAPAVLAMNWDKIKPEQRIVVAVVGAGLSWGSVVLEGQAV